jgi:coenzyme F420 hydrogenase subunit beta
MKAIESILHLRREAPARIKNMLPAHVWALAARYGLQPEAAVPEKSKPETPSSSAPLDTSNHKL